MTTRKDEPERGFTVIDRRAGGGGETREAPPAAASPPPREEPLHGPRRSRCRPSTSRASCSRWRPPRSITWASSAIPSTTSRRPTPDLPLARQTIDTLEMLQHKTRGNLDAEEDQLLEGVLYELHLRYVDVSK